MAAAATAAEATKEAEAEKAKIDKAKAGSSLSLGLFSSEGFLELLRKRLWLVGGWKERSPGLESLDE